MTSTLDPGTRSASTRMNRLAAHHTALLAGLILLLAFTALYLFTLDNGLRPGELAGGDLITHQYAQVQGRFSNAPGYPLYTMGGWLWFRIARLMAGPHSNPIPLLSSYSTLWALVALALLYALLLRVTRHNWPVAVLSTAFFGLTYFFWYYAVTTEQYTSSVAWTLAVVLLAYRWQTRRTDAHLYALALLSGVGLAHQITVLAILPPLVWFVWREEPGVSRNRGLLVRLAGLAALPLLSYAYVYIQGAQHPEWRGTGTWTSTLDWFLSFVSTSQGRAELTWSLRPFFTSEFPSLIWGEMTWPGFVTGLIGLAALGRRRAALLYGTLALYLAFCWVDRLGNWYQVIMPGYALLALGIGVSADWLQKRADKVGLRRPAAVVVLLALASLALYRGLLSYPRADASNQADDSALAPGWTILADDPPPYARILPTQTEALSLSYLTQIWGVRGDLTLISSAQARALLPHARVAVSRGALPLVPAEVDPTAHYSALGRTLVLIGAHPNADILPELETWEHLFGTELRLLGGMVMRNEATGEHVIVLSWLAASQPSSDWSVSVRLLQGDTEIGQADSEHPVHGAYPMTRWSEGEVVNDAYAFGLPEGAQPDGLKVILYRPKEGGGFTNLGIAQFELE
jgi:hypothetical protein